MEMFAGLALEFILGLLWETGMAISEDPEKQAQLKAVLAVLVTLIVGTVLCLLLACLAMVVLLLI